MSSHSIIDMCINNGLRHVQEDLQEPYPSGICVTLRDEDKNHPSQLCRDIPMLTHELGQLHTFYPFIRFGWVDCLFHQVRLPQTRLGVKAP